MPHSGLKWPNDVLIEGGKIAGILLEAEEQTLIVGSGINITPVPKEKTIWHQAIRQLRLWLWQIFFHNQWGCYQVRTNLLTVILRALRTGTASLTKMNSLLFVKHGLVMLFLLAKHYRLGVDQERFRVFFMISVWMARWFA